MTQSAPFATICTQQRTQTRNTDAHVKPDTPEPELSTPAQTSTNAWSNRVREKAKSAAT